ncbi:hypothetical protein [Escherichia phage SUSP2]|uniref:Uncharacterized protein n=1 Tax=Escherichia phage SUSP2 TaxID=1718669 RepID=A0A1D8LG14_9CAUD|nr:hypothetical protein AVU06_gp092 [Escherichia phage SUSP2]AOV70929.1 hypothetical protein [Escherichia phage SUSP2]
MIKENSIITYKGLDGFSKTGKVSFSYLSCTGNKCLALTNGENITLKEVIKIIA